MIRLRDVNRRSFTLSRVRSADRRFFASRHDTVNAIQQIVDFPNWQATCDIYRKSNRTFLTSCKLLYRNGILSLGCHEFSARNSARILKWAGVKP